MNKSLILVFGANGQVGTALKNLLSPSTTVFLDRSVADFSKPHTLKPLIREYTATAVINAAAYTQVDLAEKEQVLAQVINGEAPGILAEECHSLKIPLVHYSTDYVFSDRAGSEIPRKESDPVSPCNAYGFSKALGEKNIRQVGGDHIILRTSWVYDSKGKNFVTTMLRLGREKEKLSVVNDQWGAPTYAADLATATWSILEKVKAFNTFPSGIYNACNSGETNWYEFATAVFEAAKLHGVKLKIKDILPVPSSEYPTPAVRPKNSRLDLNKIHETFGITLPPWRESLSRCVAELFN